MPGQVDSASMLDVQLSYLTCKTRSHNEPEFCVSVLVATRYQQQTLPSEIAGHFQVPLQGRQYAWYGIRFITMLE